jgi:Ser/Thr protein kinase RdoA (MazF antagonist)
MSEAAAFDHLTPDCILDAVETALDVSLTGLTSPLPSYINRVYELESVTGDRLVAKFYRPGRWDYEALQDEHDFVLDCVEAEIPVVAPLELAGGGTIGETDDLLFAVFPKRFGREMTLCEEEGWRRIGSLVGRMHLAGSQYEAPNRLRMHPNSTTIPEVEGLLSGGCMSRGVIGRFKDVSERIIEIALREFEGVELQRIHGDCHRGNILERPDSGLILIDFDDMVTGPPVQDLWLLLPGHANDSTCELEWMLDGYEQFMEFDHHSLRLIEVLRAMRILYFLSWCSTQKDDFKFKHNFPDWGSESFWQREIGDLERQYQAILNDARLSGGIHRF